MSKAVKLDHPFDIENFSKLLYSAMGRRTQTAFASEAGVSASYLCKYLNGNFKNPPTPTTIKKIAQSSFNGITYADLLNAAGYNPQKYIDSDSSTKHKTEHIFQCFTVIKSSLFDATFNWHPKENNDNDNSFSIVIEENIIKQWNFEYIWLDNNSGFSKRLFLYYGKLAIHNYPSDSKFSLVTDSKDAFKWLCDYYPINLAVPMSFILVDLKKLKIVEEKIVENGFSDTSTPHFILDK